MALPSYEFFNREERELLALHRRMAVFPQTFRHAWGFPRLGVRANPEREHGYELRICWPDLNIELFNRDQEWEDAWEAERPVVPEDLSNLSNWARDTQLGLLEKGYRFLSSFGEDDELYFVFRLTERAKCYKLAVFSSEYDMRRCAAETDNRHYGVRTTRIAGGSIVRICNKLGVAVSRDYFVNPIGTSSDPATYSTRWIRTTRLQEPNDDTRHDIEIGRTLWEKAGYYWHGSLLLRKEDVPDDNR